MLSNRVLGLRRSVANVVGISKRYLNLQEYQCKKLMSDYDVNVQRFMMVREPADVNKIRSSFKVREFVIKAQILAGGRGKGVFRDGFKGGVHLTKDPNAMAELAQKMLGNYLVTKQTPPNGVLVNNVSFGTCYYFSHSMSLLLLQSSYVTSADDLPTITGSVKYR
ncbi:Succinyl ligase [Fasciola hepatica]|uniref:Succinyl ligase n=1 Tax=Fasciola hepatica TaxID=6192 RepID=A0A4E0R4W2_FASHE|nr:Succinyl ligase [Fasciola hepatica]